VHGEVPHYDVHTSRFREFKHQYTVLAKYSPSLRTLVYVIHERCSMDSARFRSRLMVQVWGSHIYILFCFSAPPLTLISQFGDIHFFFLPEDSVFENTFCVIVVKQCPCHICRSCRSCRASLCGLAKIQIPP